MQKISQYPNGKIRSVRYMDSDEKKRFRLLQGQQNELGSLLDRSILVCITFGKGHRDMVYNKAYDAWYCTECYNIERLSAQKRAKAKRQRTKSHEEEAIENHSKTFL
ncbi:hypothetical protein LCGC14_2240770 [marine sediment metagenome]|uniref:Uncharacterized protein n=1 Tax=marine sediment metagenome TaxID=412755 RepID=A0A0F9G0J1_9ZZZZ